MIRSLVVFGEILVCAHAHAQQIPVGFNVERYAALWARNPFALSETAAPQVRASAFEKLYLTSWLIDGGKVAVYVENSESKEVERIGSEPNQNRVRLIAMHPNANPRLVEAVISDGIERGTVKFRADQSSSEPANSTVNQSPSEANTQAPSRRVANLPDAQNSNHPSRLYPGLTRVRSEGGPGIRGPRVPGTPKKDNLPDPMSAPSPIQQN